MISNDEMAAGIRKLLVKVDRMAAEARKDHRRYCGIGIACYISSPLLIRAVSLTTATEELVRARTLVARDKGLNHVRDKIKGARGALRGTVLQAEADCLCTMAEEWYAPRYKELLKRIGSYPIPRPDQVE